MLKAHVAPVKSHSLSFRTIIIHIQIYEDLNMISKNTKLMSFKKPQFYVSRI